jgi:hypothetical protein
MNYLTPYFRTIPEFPCLRPVQRFIAKHPIGCALGAIGIIAAITVYYNKAQNVRARDLIAFYNALPEDLHKPPIQGESIITQAAFIKHWMKNEGKDAIINLRELTLTGKNLTALPPEIGLFRALEWLDLSHNQLATLPQEIGQLQALTQLGLSYNQLATLPQEIGLLQALTQLGLSGNQLAILPSEIGRLQALEGLDLSHNQLATLPQEIGLLQALTQLELSDNQLAALPQEIGLLQALEGLELSHNQLATLPQEIGQLQALTELELSGNQLAALPQEIGQLQALNGLDLSHNQLAALPESILNLSVNCIISAEHNRFVPVFLEPFNQRLRAHRVNSPYQGPTVLFSIAEDVIGAQPRTLDTMLLTWSQRFEAAFPNNGANAEFWQNRTTDFSSLLSLEAHYGQYLNEFLSKVESIQDFRPPSTQEMQKNVILRVERMIQLACTNPDFNKKMMELIVTAGDGCQDKTTIVFNEIEIEWQFHHKPLTKEEFIVLAKRAALYDLVEAYAKKFAEDNRLGDEVETILDFHLRLREKLDLPISTKTMLYRGMSGLPQDNDHVIDEAHAIMISYMQPGDEDLLVRSKQWKERLKSQNQATANAMQERYTDMLILAQDFYDLPTEERVQWLAKNPNAELYAILSHPEHGKNWEIAARTIGNALQTALKSL